MPDVPPEATARGGPLMFRIGILLTLALLPLGILAMIQAFSSLQLATQEYRNNLSAQTVRAARPESEAILSAFGLAQGLAQAAPDIVGTPEACTSIMARVADKNPTFTFAGFIDLDLQSPCNSFGRNLDFSDTEHTARIFESEEPVVTFSRSGSLSGQAIVAVSEPVRDQAGNFLGFITLTFPSQGLIDARDDPEVDSSITLVTFNGRGEVVTSDLEPEALAALLPMGIDLADLPGVNRQVFTAEDSLGRETDYAVVPIVANGAFALGIRQADHLLPGEGLFISRSIAFPLLMWLASLGVVLLAIRRLVITPIQQLRRRMRSFADGHSPYRYDEFESAPREIQEIGLTFDRVATKVMQDSAALEDKVREREILLREVHHRVKNNLQLMSSIINMQIRQDPGTEAEGALRQVQNRLASLAKFHQDLYETTALSRLRADQLIEDLTRQTVSMGGPGGRPVEVHFDLDEVVLTPDQSSPLAMLVTEALNNALKYADRDGDGPIHVEVSLKLHPGPQDRDEVEVRIANSIRSDYQDDGTARLGTRLIRAFASQLDADVGRDWGDGRYVLRLTFEVVPLPPETEPWAGGTLVTAL